MKTSLGNLVTPSVLSFYLERTVHGTLRGATMDTNRLRKMAISCLPCDESVKLLSYLDTDINAEREKIKKGRMVYKMPLEK
jgi:hypothetical protein